MRRQIWPSKRYRLIKGPIRGGSGEVWLAYDRDLGRRVALKRALLGDRGAADFDRLRAEARALAQFSHPHVVTLYDAVRLGKPGKATSWLVMEYVAGGSLDRRKPMPPEHAALIGAQVADALAALHAAGIVHCDIKPGNVVLTQSGNAKLADFGAAYRVGGRETITPNGAISYTPGYAAPEAARGQPEPASDVFSLGAMVYALVMGRPPRGQKGSPEEAGDDYIAEVKAAKGVVDLDADGGPLHDVLAAMLQRDPRDRPRAAEARRLLEEIASAPEALTLPIPDVDTAADPDSVDGEPAAGRRIWNALLASVKQHPRLATGAAAAAVALAVVVPLVQVAQGAGEGDARPGETALSAKNARSVIGDPRTADPCALTEPAALRPFGDTELDIDYGNFDRCDVLVYSGEDSAVDVKVSFDNGPAPEQAAPAKTIGAVSVVEGDAQSDECDRTLLLPGDRSTNITVTARQTGKGPAPLCGIADVATRSAAKVIGRGEIPRRSPQLPAVSLVHQDACLLLDADALASVPGIDASHPDVGFGRWDCEWDSTTTDLFVSLRFDRDQPPTAADGKATRLSGYRAFIEPKGDGDRTCLARVVYRSYADQDSQRAVEMVQLVVGGSRSTHRLCELATNLASSAATQLPHA